MVRVFAMENSGRGRFKKTRGVDHVVLIGGGVRQFSSVMQSLMVELYSVEEERCPDLVIMASVEQPELLRQAIKAYPKNIRKHIKYFMGDPTEPEDMMRVRVQDADLIIIIPSLMAKDVNSEDEANILRGLAVKNSHPKANLRLMLLRSTNKKVAVQVGFAPARCFSISEQKSGLFALACSCRGFSTMITHFIVTDNSSEEEMPDQKKGKTDPWMIEYKEGHKFHLGGFMVNANYVGISFSQFAILTTKRSVTPIAVQINGKLQLAPEHTLESGDVVFALIRHTEDLLEFADQNVNWREAFKHKQMEHMADAKNEFLSRKGLVTTASLSHPKGRESKKNEAKPMRANVGALVAGAGAEGGKDH